MALRIFEIGGSVVPRRPQAVYRLRRNRPYGYGVISFTPSLSQLLDETGQPEQVLNPEPAPAFRQNQVRIPAFNVGPGGRHRTDPIFSGHSKEHAMLAPGVRIADQLELAPAQRMERMDDAKSP